METDFCRKLSPPVVTGGPLVVFGGVAARVSTTGTENSIQCLSFFNELAYSEQILK